MSASIALQKDVAIAYLGPPGTFSHQAAYKRLGDSVAYVAQKQIDGNSVLIVDFLAFFLNK
jgi:chorismate mutase/prephenate dehydratase